ncbi:hypothetical protein J4E83_000640 [Alternaria metachromatica]|uniref:uncharacterized protein n=1 Tax=Alternaria metachromatica TaxID=283354 RepID=UPI0020C3478C|nr:uncharacterized protein J4E83_000640 [Alternaria metachromatica]XP_049216339.1 uncharacterized protein J4E79_000636 [Alternaria viburni]KAI4637822.1 hypothetical protein J4E83_000640 [Alternaria metachromatica]KAI4670355.1 hypothetical protein J4E79_000636 [Alternaria viburni]KAI4713025.1 hypothetical protein J4E89_002003 [Alternaria sp. Ai002NY15]
MAQDQANKSFWLAYCDAIKSQLGDKTGEHTSYFFSTRAQRGPPAGPASLIDPMYANMGIYEIGDSQLYTDNLFYAPTKSKSYSRALLAYMEHVDLGEAPTSTNKLNLATAMLNQTSAKEAFDAATEKAQAAWDKLKEKPEFMVPGDTWFTWKSREQKQLNSLESKYNSSVSAFDSATRDVFGDMANSYIQDKQRIRDAIYGVTPSPGSNMPVTTLGAQDADAIVRQLEKDGVVAPPKHDYYVPLYSAPEYAGQVADWLSMAKKENKPRGEATIDVNKGSKVDEKSFTHTSGGGGVSVDYVPWISLGVNASVDNKESSMFTHEDQLKTTLTMSWDDQFRAINVNSGSWDIRGKDAYKLKSGAPEEVKGLARVVQFVIVSNLAFEVQFSGNTIKEFDKQVSSAASGGGSIRLFGIPIGINAHGSKDKSDTTHRADWDSASGKLSIKPTPDGGFASIIAVIGEKV